MGSRLQNRSVVIGGGIGELVGEVAEMKEEDEDVKQLDAIIAQQHVVTAQTQRVAAKKVSHNLSRPNTHKMGVEGIDESE